MSTSPYYLDYVKTLIITNPTHNRQPLPYGMMQVDSEFLAKALTDFGCTLHQFEPLEVLDKVGYLKTGDDAAEITLDALQIYMQKLIASGKGTVVSMKDIADAIQQGLGQQGSTDASTQP
jgi:hypothetical protein